MDVKGHFGVRVEKAKAEETIVHQLPSKGQFRGALSILVILGCMIVGPMLPLVVVALLANGWVPAAATLVALLAGLHYMADHSPRWCRFYLNAAGFFTQGVFLHVEKRCIKAMTDRPSMWCMHPHGTSIGFGFSLNGAVRLRSEAETTYLPKEFIEGMPIERLRKADGVQAPVMFNIPLLRSALKGFGCCTPATKVGLAR